MIAPFSSADPPMSTSLSRPAAVLTDCHGVLVDYQRSEVRAWDWWATGHGLDPETVLAQPDGRLDRIKRWVPHLDPETEAQRLTQRQIEDTEGVTALPGALDLLTGAAAVPLAIVTSAPRLLVEARLQAAGLPLHVHMVTAEDPWAMKPNPVGYERAVQILGVPIERCHALEDSPRGVTAALRANVGLVVVTSTSIDIDAASLGGSPVVVSSVAEYLSLLRRP